MDPKVSASGNHRSTGGRGADREARPLPASRFALGGAAEDVLRTWLAADMRAARLSPAFRAYYLVRSLLPLPVRQLLQRHRRPSASTEWYLPADCVGALAEALSSDGEQLATIHPWPDGHDFAFVLTHDVETADGLRRISQIAELEQQLGFRSSWNIVPCKYRIDESLLHDLRDRGFEIGVHGYNHDGKLFSSRATFTRRAQRINETLRAWGAVGFRAPMVHRNLDWLQALEIEYDASCFDIDPYQAMPGGVGGVWPFMAGRFVELPYTVPQDHTLFIGLGERDGQIWHEKLRYVAALGGMALGITHPDYLDSPRRVEAYRRYLEEARARAAVWHALPREVAAWWRLRDSSALRREKHGGWRIEGPAAQRARVALLRPAIRGAGRRSPTPPLEWSSLPVESNSLSASTETTRPTGRPSAAALGAKA